MGQLQAQLGTTEKTTISVVKHGGVAYIAVGSDRESLIGLRQSNSDSVMDTKQLSIIIPSNPGLGSTNKAPPP